MTKRAFPRRLLTRVQRYKQSDRRSACSLRSSGGRATPVNDNFPPERSVKWLVVFRVVVGVALGLLVVAEAGISESGVGAVVRRLCGW